MFVEIICNFRSKLGAIKRALALNFSNYFYFLEPFCRQNETRLISNSLSLKKKEISYYRTSQDETFKRTPERLKKDLAFQVVHGMENGLRSNTRNWVSTKTWERTFFLTTPALKTARRKMIERISIFWHLKKTFLH